MIPTIPSQTITRYVQVQPQNKAQENIVGYMNNPIKAAFKLSGLGQEETTPSQDTPSQIDPTGAIIGLSVVPLAIFSGLLIMSGYLSYQAGKAMAPDQNSESSWGWTAVPVGMITGATGLGIMVIVSNSMK